ncbi:mucin-12 isoform X3 [Anopheles aquasalis]|uniref:mucin-12 isoform X3 n=1 Tax=Anopheles aquasalis TaxID=42839 RepID=UPI00215A7DA9|nr:mucin-12 isoform X3 [Anopheles aquasalis]
MSTLTNSASNNNNNNNHLLHHHHHHHSNHLSSSPQGSTGAASPPFLATSSPSSSIHNNNNHVPAADCNSNLINNNNSNHQQQPATTTGTGAAAAAASTTAATPPTPTSSGGGGYGGVVSGILGVREVSAKLFLPFARTMMPSSHGSNNSSNNTPTDATNGGGGGDAGTPVTPGGSGTPNQQQQQHHHHPNQHQHHHNQQQLILPESLNIVLHGYQRKLKTNRKKYFVVYGDTPDKCARLEYFDSEKKFKQSIAAVTSSLAAGGAGGSGSSSASGAPVAKRSIALRSCFNINKRHDTKKHIIALFTKDDCFCIVFESEDELYRWLRTLLKLQRGEESEGDPPRPTFEHVWDVYVQRKGLGDSYGILGNYRLCITDKILSLVRIGPAMTATGDQRVEVVEFSLASIRRCGASQRYFYLEVGRSSKTGAGEIWMEVQDSIIAQNMHTTIMKSAKNKDDNNLGPMIRIRSSSANAASKPSMLLRRPTHSGQKPINCSPSSGVAIARERCDSLPSRNRTTSETMPHQQQLQHQLQQQHHQLQQQQQQQHYQQHQQLIQNSGGMPPPRMIPSNRPHSMHISSSHSPPVNSSPLSPPPGGSVTTAGAYSTGSDGSSLSIDESTDSFMTGSLTPDEGNGFSKVINQLNSGGSIPEENSEEFIKDYSHIDMLRTGGVSGAGAGGSGGALSHHDDYGVQNHHYAARHGHLNSLSLPISQGALARRGGSPAPPSTVGSVEGSAYMEMCSPSGSSPGDPSGSCYMAMSPVADYSRGLCSSSSAHSRASSLAEDLVDGYVPMTMPRGPQSTNSAASAAAAAAAAAVTAAATAATAAGQPEEYMNMDPTVNGIGAAVGPPSHAALSSRHMNSVIGIGGMSSAASSCSITSGTPSTDLRLSLEKVTAYIGQSVDDCEMNDRPHRTYSVGSRPEHNKRKLRPDILNTSDGFGGNGATNARARAFSVGSRAKVPRSDGVRGYGNAAAAIIVPFLSANESNNNSSSSISNAGSSYTSAGGGSNSLMMMMHLDEAAGGSGGGDGGLGKKSSSGSLLPDGTKPPGHGSFDRMGDLMEIDYSVPPNRPQPNGACSGASSSSTPLKGKPSSHDQLISGGAIPGMEDYLDMTGTNYSSSNNNNNHHHHGLDAVPHHHQEEVEDDRRAAIVAAHAVAGYVEMRPGRTNSQSAETESDYLNMTPGAGAGYDVPDAPSAGVYGSASSTALSPKSTSSPIQITHSPKKFSTPVAGPVAAGGGGGGGSAGKNNNNYLEMYPRAWSNRAAPAAPRIATKVPSSEDYLNMTPLMMSAADSGSEERISNRPDDDRDDVASGGSSGATGVSAASSRTTPIVESSSAPDGYMEMWPHNHPNHHHTSQAAAAAPASDDYMNMSCGGASGGEDRLSSAPITIQPTPGKCRLDLSEEPKGDGRGQGGSGLPNYLPLGQNPDSARINATACLQQQQQHHQQHQQQQQKAVSTQGTIQTTTGQQSGWVGFSPSKANPLRARCDSRDSGIVTPSGSQATIFPFSPGSPTKPFPGSAAGSGSGASKEPLEDLSQDYAELSLSKKAAGGGAGPELMSHSSSSSANASNRRTSTGNRTAPLAEPEYVNFWPPAGARTTSNPTTPTDIGTPTPLTTTVRSRSIVDEDVAGDYALMNPAATSSRKPSTSSMGTFGGSGMIPTTSANAVAPVATNSGNTTPPALAAKKSIAFLTNNQMGFKPIASSQDTDLLRSVTTVTVAPRPNYTRQVSEWRVVPAEPMEGTAGSSSSSTMTVRPNSVNSEMIGASRGASAAAAGSAMMAGGSSGSIAAGGYASGATRPSSANSERLPPIISATSSSASSTSTLCESKNQSPSASCTTIATIATGPRPDSVSSITDPHIISRPPSVSSERELHYASLDLPPCTTKTPGPTTLPVTSPTVQKMDVDDSPIGVGTESRSSLDSNTSIPSPPSTTALQQQTVRDSSFSYAQIDFLRTAPLAQKQQQQQQPQPQAPQPSPSSMNPGADSNDTGSSST